MNLYVCISVHINCSRDEYRRSGAGNNTHYASPYGTVSLHSIQRSTTDSQQADPSHCSLYVILLRDPRFCFMPKLYDFH